ncbi:uncharacterized protein G2W53_044432 [Senna tora]|uniref:Uncharacterized protein n=1 Tax=Senna tora TaxID=362788 RepID=A0A834W1Q8_9FABA|nr:uncharacterized protein G2W53_044432 [Senna tora]
MINVPKVAYQEDDIFEQYEASIDDEDVNLRGDEGEGNVVEVIETEVDCRHTDESDDMARGKGRVTIAGVGRGGKTTVENDGGSACSRLRKGRSLSQNGGSFNYEIEETPIELLLEVGDGGNHVEEFHPHQGIHDIGKINQKQFGGSWIVWNEVPQEVKDLWFSEFKSRELARCGKKDTEEVRQEIQKEMQDMKKRIMEQLLVSYGMHIPSPPSQPLVRSVGSSTLPNKDL